MDRGDAVSGAVAPWNRLEGLAEGPSAGGRVHEAEPDVPVTIFDDRSDAARTAWILRECSVLPTIKTEASANPQTSVARRQQLENPFRWKRLSPRAPWDE